MTTMRVGLISDTHGWLDPQVPRLFHGVDAILHAGDVGSRAVVDALGDIARLFIVRGNVDRSPEWQLLPERLDLTLAGTTVHLVHRPVDALPGDAQVVMCGHTHRALVEERQGQFWINPGAAGRRGFHSERTAAIMVLGDGPPRVSMLDLGPRSARRAEHSVPS